MPPPHKHVLVPQVSVELPLLLPSSEESLAVSIVTCLTWLYSAPVLEAWWGRAAWERQAAADAMEALGAVLSCPVCMELFSPPVLLLSCSHNFCKQCLELILVCQNCTHGNGQFCCPVCRKVIYLRGRGTNGLQRNILAENILEKFKEELEMLHTKDQNQLAQTCEKHGESVNLVFNYTFSFILFLLSYPICQITR
ncbi:hypothetical protein J1605_007798 [Eschrichtius robustus]|uniref:RING-type domain-containing protein n=1 Tax=Eschrichtius robustus TaxID=9764 RepID=A0AB34H129_ESCRO|nr:hypothetical protein J1605_007798 [Eschrichtius robustus]